MTTTMTRTQPLRVPDGQALRLAPVRKRRRPFLALGSLVLIAACVAGFASVYVRAERQVAVIALARQVEQGQQLTTADLKVVRISFDSGLSVIPVSSASSVVGRAAAVPLAAGVLLSQTDLTPGQVLPPGDSIVGVSLKPSQLPAEGVSPGEAVDLVMTGAPNSADTTSGATSQGGQGLVSGPGTVIAPDVLVTAVNVSPQASGSDTEIVSVLVTRALAPVVASASAAGQVALVLISTSS